VLFLVWPYVQPLYSAGVAHAANVLLAVEEMGQRVTRLRPSGGTIQVWSTLRDDGEPADTYNADVLHFYIVPALALVMAFPGLRVWARLRALVVTIGAFFVFHALALLVVVEHTYAVVLAEVARRNYTAFEAAVYRWLFENFAYLAVQLAPAATLLLLFLFYGGSAFARARRPAGTAVDPSATAEAPGAAETPELMGPAVAAETPKAAESAGPAEPPARPRVRIWVTRVALAVAAAASAAVFAFAAWVHLEKVAARRSEDHCALGFKALQAGSTVEASRLFRRATALKPDLLEAQDGLGHSLLMAGEVAAAEAAFREALRIDGGYLPSLMGMANALLTLERTEEALAFYGRAAAMHGDRWEPEYNIGMALVRARRQREAEPHLAKAIELNPSMPDARLELAKIFMTTQRVCRALPHLEAFAALEPASPHADLVRRTLDAARSECGRPPAR